MDRYAEAVAYDPEIQSDQRTSGAVESAAVSSDCACPGLNSSASNAASPRPIAELAAQITELAGHLNAANHRWLILIAEFDRREGWADGTTISCAHWLSWKCGLDRGAAREKVRVARALEALPLISAAMARGEVSYSKVRALTRIATPRNEDELLMIALHGTANHVEALVRKYRRAEEACELGREASQFATRGLTWYFDDDGSLFLQARLPAEGGAVVLRALELATATPRRTPDAQDVSAETSRGVRSTDDHELASEMAGAGVFSSDQMQGPRTRPGLSADDTDHPSPRQRRADALVCFAESWLAHGPKAMAGGERQQIVIHVDAESLRQETPGRCEVEGGPSIAVQTARRLSCDASLVTVIEDEAGQALDVGRKTRSIPPAIRRALRSRDTGCRFPGCSHKFFLDGHHIRHWADGGETKLSNLVLLCRFHHRQVHEGRVQVRMLDDGALRFTGARGQALEDALPLSGKADALSRAHAQAGLAIDARTAVTRWCGERLDYDLAIWCLMNNRSTTSNRDVSAETRSDADPR